MVGKVYVMAESHPENLINGKVRSYKRAHSLTAELVSKYGAEAVERCLVKAVRDPNWIGHTGFDDEIREIACLVGGAVEYGNDSNRIISIEAKIIEDVNPSVFYLEGRGGNAPHIEKATNGKRVIHLDEGCTWYDVEAESGAVETDPSYILAQTEREKHWAEMIARNPPAENESGLVKVGYKHVTPKICGHGYGNLINLLREKGICPQTIRVISDELKYYDQEDGVLPNHLRMYNV